MTILTDQDVPRPAHELQNHPWFRHGPHIVTVNKVRVKRTEVIATTDLLGTVHFPLTQTITLFFARAVRAADLMAGQHIRWQGGGHEVLGPVLEGGLVTFTLIHASGATLCRCGPDELLELA